MISNSYHSSAKSHSISSAGALAKAERHNDRGYFSFYYDESKIAQLVGNSGTLAADVEAAINEIFNPYVAEYNDRQKRADRKIRTSAFEYFCDQKKLDIATEAIFQIGDKEFWARWRTDTVVHRNGKEVVLKSFPDEIKTVMNEILARQVKAYEEIYRTHGAEIARRIRAAYESAQATAQTAEDLHPGFADLYNVPSKLRAELIGNLDPADQISYAEYATARDTLAAIVKHNILDRAEAGQMHIKVVTSTGHYDEFSPHAHTIGLAWSDGYKTGLSSRVSKSVVLNKWALEVIQERLNEIAREEIAKHPEIFVGEEIKPTEKGRAMNYSTEQITRKHLAELEADVRDGKAKLKTVIDTYKELKETNDHNLEVIEEQRQKIAINADRLKEQAEIMDLYQTHDEYLKGGIEANKAMDDIQEDLESLPQQHKIFQAKEADSWRQRTMRRLQRMMNFVKYTIGKLQIFEREHPEEAPEQLSAPAKERASALDDVINNAQRKSQNQGYNYVVGDPKGSSSDDGPGDR